MEQLWHESCGKHVLSCYWSVASFNDCTNTKPKFTAVFLRKGSADSQRASGAL